MEAVDRRARLLAALKASSAAMPLTVKELAELVSASVRTVHYDLDIIATEVAAGGYRLERRARVGVWLEADAGVAAGASQVVYTPRERQDRIVLALLSGTPASIDELAERLFVSRTTLLADLKDVQSILERRGLAYCSKRGLGIWAEGDEQSVRDMLIHIFSRASYDFRTYREIDERAGQELFREFSRGLPVTVIASFFLRLLQEHHILENDSSANRMICALVVELARLRGGHTIAPSSEEVAGSLELGALAAEIADSLEPLQAGFVAPGEQLYLVRELLHSRIYIFPERERSGRDVNIAAVELARAFIRYAQTRLGDYYLDDDELLYQLAMHLQPAIERARFGIVLTNPLLTSIKRQYPSLYQIAQAAARSIEREQGLTFSEDEIGYLTIHLGGAVERRNMKREKALAVLLICGSGIGTGRLLEMTLKNHLPYLNIVKTVSLYKLTEQDVEAVDIVISTVEVDIPGRAVLRVSPILSDAGIRVIEGQLRYFFNKKYMPELIATDSPATNRLTTLLDDSVIDLDVSVRSWEEAVRRAGGLLERSGAVTPSYVDKMVQMVRTIGPYIVVTDGVAMPHARIEDGAQRVAVSLVQLAQPVRFGSDEREVDLLFAFSTTDEKAHIDLLADMWRLFNDAAALASVRAATTPADVIATIKRLLAE